MSTPDRPPRHPLGQRAQTAVRAVVGSVFVVLGLAFATTSNIKYAPGDIRGTAAFGLVTGGVMLVLGIVVLLSIRYPRLRGRRRE